MLLFYSSFIITPSHPTGTVLLPLELSPFHLMFVFHILFSFYCSLFSLRSLPSTTLFYLVSLLRYLPSFMLPTSSTAVSCLLWCSPCRWLVIGMLVGNGFKLSYDLEQGQIYGCQIIIIFISTD